MNLFKEQKHYFYLLIALIVGGSFFAGYSTGKMYGGPSDEERAALQNTSEGKPTTVDFAPFWRVWNILNERYVAKKKIPGDQEKVWGAIQGLTASIGDPYTIFLPPEEKKFFDQEIRGNFEGVAMEIGIKDKILTVI